MIRSAEEMLYTAVLFAVASFFLVFILLKLIMLVGGFRRELKYIKNAIRETDGEDRRYWEREKRRLWLSLIPFYRR